MHWKMHFEMKSNVGRGASVSKKALHWDVAGAPWTDQVYLSRMSLNPFHPWSFWQITCVTYKTFRLIKYLFQEESIEEISSPPPTRRQQLLLLLSRFSHVRLCATPETAAQQASLSLGFSRQEHWSGLPFPSPMRESEKWSEVAKSCPTLSDPMDCSLPGSSIHGIFQARVLEWGAIAFSRDNSTGTLYRHIHSPAQAKDPPPKTLSTLPLNINKTLSYLQFCCQ